MSALITIVLIIYIALLALFTALPARKRHWSMVLVRTGIIIVAVIAAVPLSKLVASAIGEKLYELIEPSITGDLAKFMGDVPLVAESFQLIVSLFIAPLMFLLIFAVIRGLMGLSVWIVERCIPDLRETSTVNTAIAMPIGAVNGILVALVTLIPICGYVALANSAVTAFTAVSGDGSLAQEEIAAPSVQGRYEFLSENFVQNQDPALEDAMNMAEELTSGGMIDVMNTIGTPLFNWMTSGTLDDGNIKFTLAEELPHLTESAAQLAEATAGMEDEDISPEDVEALVGAVNNLLSSDWVAEIAADSISCIASTWQEGESFMGIEPPEVGSILQPIMDTALTVLSTESAETLRTDVDTVLHVMADLMSVGFLTDDPDYDKLMEELGKDGFISGLMAKLSENPHMAPLAEEVKTVSVKVVSSVLGETLKNTTEYDPLIETVAGQLNDVLEMSKEEREPIIREAVKAAFVEYGVPLSEDLAVEFSEKALAEVGADGEIHADELKQYLIDHVDEGMGLADGVINGGEDINIPDLGI